MFLSRNSINLEKDITEVVSKILCLSGGDIAELIYLPVPLAKKFTKGEKLIKSRITSYITEYYTYIREQLKEMDGINGFQVDILSMQIKSAFLKMEAITSDKELIFNHLTDWVKQKTLSDSRLACEVVVAFFVQNCEVFHEITK